MIIMCSFQTSIPSNTLLTLLTVVIGSGPDGGVVASNLVLASYSVLLLEAGPDATLDQNTYIAPIYYPRLSSDRWVLFVNMTSSPA
jgi:choline dehydrogenase-like flavoprotein